MMDYRLRLKSGHIIRPIRLECGDQIAIYKGEDGKEYGVPRSYVKEILFDGPRNSGTVD
jgi:hypothetical protein